MEIEKSFNIASTKRRLSSFVIDDLIVTTFFIIIFFEQLSKLFGNITVIDDRLILNINIFISANIWILLSIKVLYHAILVSQNGMTIGKYIMKIKVIDLDTSNIPTLQKSLIRAVVRMPSESVLYLGFALAFFTPLKQTLHDKLSSCIVVDA